MDKKWLQLSIGSKSKADVLDVATLVSTRGREDLSVCLRSSPACVCTAPRVLGLLLINLVHYLDVPGYEGISHCVEIVVAGQM